MTAKAIETSYAGCRFRSRLEARWAVFFDHADVEWEYEPQGFVIDGRPYLPDFRLGCGTWVEVKGDDAELDHDLMRAAAQHLPGVGTGPRLLILGPIPGPPNQGSLGWLGLEPVTTPGGEVFAAGDWWGFGYYASKRRLWALRDTSSETPADYDEMPWLAAAVDPYELSDATDAYRAARSARFEHGESGAR